MADNPMVKAWKDIAREEMAKDAGFNESDHPRDKGKFAAKGSGSSGGGGPKDNTGKNVAKGIESHTDKTEAAEKKFPKGTKVRENRSGAPAYEVTGHSGNMLHLSNGKLIHVTKAVSAEHPKDNTGKKKSWGNEVRERNAREEAEMRKNPPDLVGYLNKK